MHFQSRACIKYIHDQLPVKERLHSPKNEERSIAFCLMSHYELSASDSKAKQSPAKDHLRHAAVFAPSPQQETGLGKRFAA